MLTLIVIIVVVVEVWTFSALLARLDARPTSAWQLSSLSGANFWPVLGRSRWRCTPGVAKAVSNITHYHSLIVLNVSTDFAIALS